MNEDHFERMTYAEYEAHKWAGKFTTERDELGDELFLRVKKYCIYQLAPNELDTYVVSVLEQRITDFYKNIDTNKASLLEFELGL